MSSKNNAQTALTNINLLADKTFASFIQLQSRYGIAQRGGTALFTNNETHATRVISNVNILSSQEVNVIVFENFISKN
jgi:hypothetical protein